MSESNVVELEDVVDISKVEGLLESLKKSADKGGQIKVDASKVTRIDTAGLQLMFSFQKTLNDQHGQVTIVNPSDDFMKNARLVGFNEVLMF